MVPSREPTLHLQAAPARSDDAGRNMVRLPHGGLASLGVDEGDPVAIESRSGLLWARAFAAHPDDEGIAAARLDATEIECPELLEGGLIRVRAAPVRVALEVEIATEADLEEPSAERLRKALEDAG